MSEESKSRSPWDALADLIPKDLREMVGFLLGFFIIFGGIIAVGKLPKYIDSLTYSPAKQFCWSLKDIHGNLIKFNQCTGETVQMNIKNFTPQSQDLAPDICEVKH